MQQVWRKKWNLLVWIALVAVTLVLLAFAASTKNHKVCNGIEVSFNEDGNNSFVDEKGVVAELKTFGSIKGQEIKNIDLNALEARLRNSKWIANAQLFFDNKQVLQAIVEEKQPVARIFTATGSSFYIDSACKKLPLSEKLSARIPMFTSFPSDKVKLSRPDSQLLASVKELAMFIQSDEFWKAQVSQVNITPDGFEMIPTVGNHVVELGKDGNFQQKFDRLFSFYRQVWTKVGFEKYEKVDVQFDGQVVATVKGLKPVKVDSAGARLAYQNLLAEVKNSDADTVLPVNAAKKDTVRANVKGPVANVEAKKILPAKENSVRTAPKSAPVRPAVLKGLVLKQAASNKREDANRVPKAIMKKSK